MTLAHVVFPPYPFVVILNNNMIYFFIEFKISAAIRQQPHGGNSPLNILSSVAFDELRRLVAKKLNRFPGLLNL